ncbi:hypothetical protein ACFLTK_05190, partial [Chloroflexota bacterium]
MRCANHFGVETNLRCGKCGNLICPKCMVQTPVGARCLDCAQVHKLPTYRVTTQYYLRAIGTGLGMAIVSGIVWGIIESVVPFFSLNLLLASGVGYAIGEVISLSVNRKRGKGLAAIAGIAVVVSYLFTFPVIGFPFGIFNILYHIVALALGIIIAVIRL